MGFRGKDVTCTRVRITLWLCLWLDLLIQTRARVGAKAKIMSVVSTRQGLGLKLVLEFDLGMERMGLSWG